MNFGTNGASYGMNPEQTAEDAGRVITEIKRLGRSTQGVIVMRLRRDEQVSSIALVAESDDEDAEPAPEPAPEVESTS